MMTAYIAAAAPITRHNTEGLLPAYLSQKLKHDRTLRRHVMRKLKHYWSPEQIAGRLQRMTKHTVVSHETTVCFVIRWRIVLTW